MRTGNLTGQVNGGEWQTVYDSGELGAAVASITIPNLDGNNDKEYRLILRHINGYSGGNGTVLNVNSDTTDSNYGFQVMNGTSSAASASYSNSRFYLSNNGTGPGNVSLAVMTVYAKSGFVRTGIIQVNNSVVGTTIQAVKQAGWVWNNSTDNITSLSLVDDQTNGIGIGSRVILMKRAAVASGMDTGTLDVQGKLGGSFQLIKKYTVATPAQQYFTPDKSLTVDYLVVAGGGGGATYAGGGGGGGGMRVGTGMSLTAQAYAVTIGKGGTGAVIATDGTDSVFNGITSTGGGAGVYYNDGTTPGHNGGSGGGGGGGIGYPLYPPGGSGNTPSTSPSQGANGGTGARTDSAYPRLGGGGGGGGADGVNGTSAVNYQAGAGGAGTLSSISGSSVRYAGGGGGGAAYSSGGGAAGAGGGGAGGVTNTPSTAGTNGLGGGGGGGPWSDSADPSGKNGGHGRVIISYTPAVGGVADATGGTITQSGGKFIHTFDYVADGETSYSFTGLDGNTDVLYRLICRHVNGYSGTSGLRLSFNADTASNYGYQGLRGVAAATSSPYGTDTGAIMPLNSPTALASIGTIDILIFAKSGYIRTCLLSGSGNVATTTVGSSEVSGWSWNNTADNITAMVLTAAQANGLGVGTVIELYAYRP